MIVRLLACVIAICLVGGAVQAADLATLDDAAELAPGDALVLAVDATATAITPIRTTTTCELPTAGVPVSRLHVTDAFRPPQA